MNSCICTIPCVRSISDDMATDTTSVHVQCTYNNIITHLLLYVFCMSVIGAEEAGGRGREDDMRGGWRWGVGVGQ